MARRSIRIIPVARRTAGGKGPSYPKVIGILDKAMPMTSLDTSIVEQLDGWTDRCQVVASVLGRLKM
jgi:hypothetical protein